ncbi:(S)-2-haloacid dehalogenase 4A [Arthrobacter sp. Hiyo6]|nr:(S)-2-haloacid dehalogenase 4A [Arthrobacter sp. Hiyo6]
MTFQPYRSPSTGCEVRAVLFDTFGTVVDWRTGVARQAAAFAAAHGQDLDARRSPMTGAPSTSRPWRPSAPDPANSSPWTHSTAKTWTKCSATTASIRTGWTQGPGGVEQILHRLPPWPDSVDGLAATRRGYIVGPLSNGNTSLLLDMARNAGLPWDVIIGSDMTRTYKPLPAAYLRTAEFLDLKPGAVMLVAAHNNDLRAAREAGLATAFIARPTEYGPGQVADLTPESDWDLSASSITELAHELGA